MRAIHRGIVLFFFISSVALCMNSTKNTQKKTLCEETKVSTATTNKVQCKRSLIDEDDKVPPETTSQQILREKRQRI